MSDPDGDRERDRDSGSEDDVESVDVPSFDDDFTTSEDANGDALEDSDERSGPLDDLASEVDGTAPDKEHFDDAGRDRDLDREALWRQVAGEDAPDRVTETGLDADNEDRNGPTIRRPNSATTDTDAEPDETDDGPTERVVDKAAYCHKCEFFSSPPEVRCTNEGTKITELVDVDHFRVVDCPIVAEDDQLERL